MKFRKFIEENNFQHWDQKPLSGYIYDGVFDLNFFNLLKNNVNQILSLETHTTFMTNNCVLNVDDQQYKLGSSIVFGRDQVVIFDYTFNLDWFNQTNESIRPWIMNQVNTDVGPIFNKVIDTVYNMEPFKQNPNDWVIYRLHLNHLKTNEFLTLHYDGNRAYINKAGNDTRLYSVTFYLHDHVPNMGGEIWSVNGFVYKPVANSAIAITGSSCLHGVTANMDNKPRQAFTLRIIHKDDLYLPGSAESNIWSINTLR